jgi:hypothetical protein
LTAKRCAGVATAIPAPGPEVSEACAPAEIPSCAFANTCTGASSAACPGVTVAWAFAPALTASAAKTRTAVRAGRFFGPVNRFGTFRRGDQFEEFLRIAQHFLEGILVVTE